MPNAVVFTVEFALALLDGEYETPKPKKNSFVSAKLYPPPITPRSDLIVSASTEYVPSGVPLDERFPPDKLALKVP